MKLAAIQLDQLRIVKYPDPVLRQVCAEITEFGPGLEALGRRMLELMRQNRGIGLAGPQVGLLLRLFVCNTTGEPEDDRIWVNPKLSDFEGGEEANEGCLSLPEVTVPVRRPARVTITARDPAGREIVRRGEGLNARVWQHETDHLVGRLIIDSMSTESEFANRQALKQLESEYRPRRERKLASQR
jgi:peptide deformylase